MTESEFLDRVALLYGAMKGDKPATHHQRRARLGRALDAASAPAAPPVFVIVRGYGDSKAPPSYWSGHMWTCDAADAVLYATATSAAASMPSGHHRVVQHAAETR
jgi:hypothetical protein